MAKERKTEPVAMIFGRRLAALRKERHLTQEALGRLIKMDYKFLGALERGEKTPSFESIQRIARALNVDYYEFFLPDSLLGAESAGRLISVLSKLPKNRWPELHVFFRSLFDTLRTLENDLR